MTTLDDTAPPLAALPEQPVPEYVRLPKAAERLDISEDTLWRYARHGLQSGEIASYRLGRARVISWSSLLAYLSKYYPGATTQRGHV